MQRRADISEKAQIVIHPQRGNNERELPACGLFCANALDARKAHELLQADGGERRYLHQSQLTVAEDGGMFVAGPSVGAPLAVLSLEKMIVLGARKILFFGWCGSIASDLRIGEIVIGARPVSGEGTSRYYPLTQPSLPSAALQEAAEGFCKNRNFPVSRGNLWSTDAPYREDWQLLRQLRQQEQVRAIDMEYSALCTVAAFRGIELAGVFVVSDELFTEQWQPGFASDAFRGARASLLPALLQFVAGGCQ